MKYITMLQRKFDLFDDYFFYYGKVYGENEKVYRRKKEKAQGRYNLIRKRRIKSINFFS